MDSPWRTQQCSVEKAGDLNKPLFSCLNFLHCAHFPPHHHFERPKCIVSTTHCTPTVTVITINVGTPLFHLLGKLHCSPPPQSTSPAHLTLHTSLYSSTWSKGAFLPHPSHWDHLHHHHFQGFSQKTPLPHHFLHTSPHSSACKRAFSLHPLNGGPLHQISHKQ